MVNVVKRQKIKQNNQRALHKNSKVFISEMNDWSSIKRTMNMNDIYRILIIFKINNKIKSCFHILEIWKFKQNFIKNILTLFYKTQLADSFHVCTISANMAALRPKDLNQIGFGRNQLW